MSRGQFFVGAGLILLILFCGQRHGLWRNGEMREVETGREMYLSGNWSVPKLNHEVYLEKPPLVYASVAATYLIAGRVSDNLARVLSSFYGALGLIALMLLGRRIGGERVGLWAGAILATASLFFVRSHTCSIDITLAAFVTLTLFFFHRAYREGKEHYSWAELLPIYLFATLAFYTKSFIGLILPGAAIVVFFVLMRDWKGAWRIKPWVGAVIFAALISPWFFDLWRQGGTSYLKMVFIDNLLLRFVETEESNLGHHTRWYWYFDIIWKYFLPWSLLLIPAAITLFRREMKERLLKSDRLFIVAWFVGDFLLLTASSTKREVYMLPFFPAAALAVALWIDQRLRAAGPKWEQAVLAAGGAALAVAAVALPVWLAFEPRIGDRLALIAVPAALAAIGLALAWRRDANRLATAGLALLWVAGMTASCFYLPVYSLDHDASPFARAVTAMTPDAKQYYFLQEHGVLGYMDFYSGKPAVDMATVDKQVAKPLQLVRLAAGPEPVYLVMIAQQQKTEDSYQKFVRERGARLKELYREPVSDRTSVLWQLVPAAPEDKP